MSYLGVFEVIEGKEVAVGETSPTTTRVVGGTVRAGLDEGAVAKAATGVATVTITAEEAGIVAVGRRVSAGLLRPSEKTWTRSWMPTWRTQEVSWTISWTLIWQVPLGVSKEDVG